MKTYTLGIEFTLEVMGGKWKALIVCLLMTGKKRTSELERAIPGISQKVLIQQLRELEREGIVYRQVYDQLPPKVEYHITEYGKTLDAVIHTMCQWGGKALREKQDAGEDIDFADYNPQDM